MQKLMCGGALVPLSHVYSIRLSCPNQSHWDCTPHLFSAASMLRTAMHMIRINPSISRSSSNMPFFTLLCTHLRASTQYGFYSTFSAVLQVGCCSWMGMHHKRNVVTVALFSIGLNSFGHVEKPVCFAIIPKTKSAEICAGTYNVVKNVVKMLWSWYLLFGSNSAGLMFCSGIQASLAHTHSPYYIPIVPIGLRESALIMMRQIMETRQWFWGSVMAVCLFYTNLQESQDLNPDASSASSVHVMRLVRLQKKMRWTMISICTVLYFLKQLLPVSQEQRLQFQLKAPPWAHADSNAREADPWWSGRERHTWSRKRFWSWVLSQAAARQISDTQERRRSHKLEAFAVRSIDKNVLRF